MARLDELQRRHHDMFAVYDVDHKPKHHMRLHLPAQLLRTGCFVDCEPVEDKHRLYKSGVADRQDSLAQNHSAFSRSVLPRLLQDTLLQLNKHGVPHWQLVGHIEEASLEDKLYFVTTELQTSKSHWAIPVVTLQAVHVLPLPKLFLDFFMYHRVRSSHSTIALFAVIRLLSHRPTPLEWRHACVQRPRWRHHSRLVLASYLGYLRSARQFSACDLDYFTILTSFGGVFAVVISLPLRLPPHTRWTSNLGARDGDALPTRSSPRYRRHGLQLPLLGIASRRTVST